MPDENLFILLGYNMVLPIKNTLSVMTLNLRHAWADDGDHSWDNRKKTLVSLFNNFSPQIVAFQEVNQAVIPFLKNCLPDHEYLGDARPRGEYWEYRPIFVPRSWPVKLVETISLSKKPEVPSKSWGSEFIRQATRVVVAWPETSLAIYNTHLDFKPRTRLNQVKVLWDWLARHDNSRPSLLCGDFNTSPAEEPYRFLTDFPGDFKNAALVPRQASFHKFTGLGRPGPIDWILYRGGLVLQEPAEAIRYNLQGIYPSDHFPVLAEFQLPGGGRTV